MGEMSFAGGFFTGRAKCAGKTQADQKVFDWHMAAQILRDRKVDYAEAGLQGDFDYTGGGNTFQR